MSPSRRSNSGATKIAASEYGEVQLPERAALAFPEVAELRFSHSAGPALFGIKDELIAEWSMKLGINDELPP